MMWLILLTVLIVVVAALDQPHYVDGVHVAHSDEALCRQLTKPLTPQALAYEQSEDDERVQSLLAALQGQCDARRSRILLFELHSDCGFGAELHWLTVALTAAVVTNRTLVIREDRPWIYADAAFCAAGATFSCYFEPLSSCTVRSRADLDALLDGVPLADVPIFTTKEMHKHADARVVHYTTDLQQQLDFGFFRSMPSGWKTGREVFWWRSQLVKYVMRLNARVAGLVEARRDALGLRAVNALGIHSRRGDKLFGSAINNPETRVEVPMSAMYAVARDVALACGLDAVFVATKDGDFVDYVDAQLANETAKRPLRWIIDRTQPRTARGWSTHDLLRGMLNRTQEALDVVSDTYLLASVTAFIGVMESNLSRLAAELGEALRSFERPAMSFNATNWITFP